MLTKPKLYIADCTIKNMTLNKQFIYILKG
jgi:hypothetical protein